MNIFDTFVLITVGYFLSTIHLNTLIGLYGIHKAVKTANHVLLIMCLLSALILIVRALGAIYGM